MFLSTLHLRHWFALFHKKMMILSIHQLCNRISTSLMTVIFLCILSKHHSIACRARHFFFVIVSNSPMLLFAFFYKSWMIVNIAWVKNDQWLILFPLSIFNFLLLIYYDDAACRQSMSMMPVQLFVVVLLVFFFFFFLTYSAFFSLLFFQIDSNKYSTWNKSKSISLFVKYWREKNINRKKRTRNSLCLLWVSIKYISRHGNRLNQDRNE